MADIELVIKISEETKEQIIALTNVGESFPPKLQERIVRAIINGTPLQKGHGRILDEKDILDTENNSGGWYDLVDMPEYIAGVKAIIPADKE